MTNVDQLFLFVVLSIESIHGIVRPVPEQEPGTAKQNGKYLGQQNFQQKKWCLLGYYRCYFRILRVQDAARSADDASLDTFAAAAATWAQQCLAFRKTKTWTPTRLRH